MNQNSDEDRSSSEEERKIKDMESSLDKLQTSFDQLRQQLKEVKALIDAAKKAKRKQNSQEEPPSTDFAIAI